jgi:hypothetical protein
MKGRNGSFPADPEQACHAGVDLVNKGQVSVTFAVLDLIDSDGVDGSERPVRQSERDHMLDGVEDLVP